jgi:hypothetical protein
VKASAGANALAFGHHNGTAPQGAVAISTGVRALRRRGRPFIVSIVMPTVDERRIGIGTAVAQRITRFFGQLFVTLTKAHSAVHDRAVQRKTKNNRFTCRSRSGLLVVVMKPRCPA